MVLPFAGRFFLESIKLKYQPTMSKQQITEEMNVHQQWYVQAKEQTQETLMQFINHLCNDYQHDYGTICHALSASAIAAAYAVNSSPNGGITGFQAGAVMWNFIQKWMYDSNQCGLRIIDFDKMLYPQYEDNFQKTISGSTWDSLKKAAAKNLKDTEHASPSVLQHWKSITEGIVPFGYSVTENR